MIKGIASTLFGLPLVGEALALTTCVGFVAVAAFATNVYRDWVSMQEDITQAERGAQLSWVGDPHGAEQFKKDFAAAKEKMHRERR